MCCLFDATVKFWRRLTDLNQGARRAVQRQLEGIPSVFDQDIGTVVISAVGCGLTHVHVHVKAEVPLVLIPAGVTFLPANAAVQKMVTLCVAPIRTNRMGAVPIPAACLEMRRTEPEQGDTLKVLPPSNSGLSPDLGRLVEQIQVELSTSLLARIRQKTFGRLATYYDPDVMMFDICGREQFRIFQFAIWILTDIPHRNGFVGINSRHLSGDPRPTNQDYRDIKALFARAGVECSSYHAFQ